MAESKPGYVYIMTNPSFKENWVKIGKSARPVELRLKELDTTSVPMPFEIYATLKTSKFNEVEKKTHREIDRFTDFRVRKNREFFEVEPQVALDLLKDIASLLDDAEIKEYKAPEEPESVSKERRAPFKFSMAEIKAGEEVTFMDADIAVKVADEKHIEYQGDLYTLSGFCSTFMPEDKQNVSGAYCGPEHFTYKGELFSNLRLLHEKSEK